MTMLRRDLGAISNYFNALIADVGPRGSSFSDIDAITHDEHTHRFLVQEFKNAHETIPIGQARMLQGLARIDYVTVWCVRRVEDGRIQFFDVRTGHHDVIYENEYRARFARWWAGHAVVVGDNACHF